MQNEDNRKPLLDASAYVLIEEIGDSDAQLLESQHSDAAAGEDDAQSSCSRSARSSSGCQRKEEDDGTGDLDGGCGLGKDEDGGGGTDLEDGVVDQCRGGGKNESAKRSSGCEGSAGVKMMSEREGDRLFWEACLASP